MKSRGGRLEHRAVVDERGHQGALLHRPFRPTEVLSPDFHIMNSPGSDVGSRCRYGKPGI